LEAAELNGMIGLTSYKVFALLMGEMGLFMLLLVPLPFKIKRKIFT
jgi:hypothetical protein